MILISNGPRISIAQNSCSHPNEIEIEFSKPYGLSAIYVFNIFKEFVKP